MRGAKAFLTSASPRAAVSVAMVLGFLLVRTIGSWRANGDTVILVAHTQWILDCLRGGKFHGCTIVHFPLFQFIPGVLLKAWGASEKTIFSFFALLNWAAFAATVTLTWVSLQKETSRAVALVAVFLLLTSPFLPYAVDTFNEPTAAFITLAFAVAVVAGARLRWVACLCFLAAITKETAPPFLLLIGLLGLFRRRQPIVSKTRYVAVLLCAAGMGIAINSAFNYFRYDSVLNVQNLAREFRVDTLGQAVSNFFGLWLAPNGGLLPFWFSFACIPIVIGVAAVSRRRDGAVGPWPARVLAVILLGQTVGLSTWYAPHGWIAWGPRLLLPWLPATLYLTCYFYFPLIERGAALVTANRWRAAIAAVLLTAAALPNFFQVLNWHVVEVFFLQTRFIPIQEDRAGYFAQINYMMWLKRSMMLESYQWFFDRLFRDKLLLYAVCTLVLAQAIWASARRTGYRVV
jgi:hypothetical protein